MDKCIAATVAYILKCPASTVPQAMRACKFSDKESMDAGKQMAVHRACDKALAGKKRPSPPSVISASRSGKKSVSPLSTVVTSDGSQLQALVAVRPADTRMGPITQQMSKERIELLAYANTHGKKSFATGGSHVCSDDFFKAKALLAREVS